MCWWGEHRLNVVQLHRVPSLHIAEDPAEHQHKMDAALRKLLYTPKDHDHHHHDDHHGHMHGGDHSHGTLRHGREDEQQRVRSMSDYSSAIRVTATHGRPAVPDTPSLHPDAPSPHVLNILADADDAAPTPFGLDELGIAGLASAGPVQDDGEQAEDEGPVLNAGSPRSAGAASSSPDDMPVVHTSTHSVATAADIDGTDMGSAAVVAQAAEPVTQPAADVEQETHSVLPAPSTEAGAPPTGADHQATVDATENLEESGVVAAKSVLSSA